MDISKLTKLRSPLRIPPAVPIRKQRLWSHGQSSAQPFVTQLENTNYSLGKPQDSLALSDLTTAPPESLSPATTTLSNSVTNPEPFWEPDYPSQRFRPLESEERDPYYTPPPQFFSPPISPNEDRVNENFASDGPLTNPEAMTSTSENPYKTMKPTPLAPDYKGLQRNPYQNSYLTSYGMFADRAGFADAAHGGVHTIMSPLNGQHDPDEPTPTAKDSFSELNDRFRKVSCSTVANDSSLSSDVEIHPSSGVLLGEMELKQPKSSQYQTKTFQDLASEKGIMEWNNEVFDERWLEPSRPKPVNVNRSQEFANKSKLKDSDVVSTSDKRPQRLESFLKELDDTREKMDSHAGTYRPDPSIWGMKNAYPQYAKALREQHHVSELAPEPPELQRLRDVISDLEAGTDALPRGITHHPDVLRRYFYDRVFQGEWDGQIGSPEGDNMTKHAGRFISLTTLRDQVLKDIEDLIAFMTVPVGESTRSAMFYRTPEAKTAPDGHSLTKEPFVPEYMPGINSRGYRYAVREDKHPISQINTSEGKGSQHPSEKSTTTSKSAYQPFVEKLTAIESRRPFLDKLRAMESSDNKRPNDRPEADSVSGKFGQHKDKVGVSTENTISEGASTTQNPVDLSRQSTSQQRSPSQENLSSSQATLVPSSQETMEGPSLSDILQRPMEAEKDRVNEAKIPHYPQRSHQYQLPTHQQRLPFDGLPTGFYPTATNQDQWTSVPVVQQGYGYQQQSGSLHRPPYVVPQPLQYAPQPMQYGYAQRLDSYPSLDKGPPPPYTGPADHFPLGMSRYPLLGQQSVIGRSDFGPPPPPGPYANVAVRAPAPNRVAAMVYRNDPALQYSGLPQVRGTPVPTASQDHATPSISLQNHHEWQNRFGLLPAIKPDIPVMAYRPGSDDMRPHPGSGPSIPFQNLTRHAVPTFDEARALDNLPFTEIGKEAKPPGWGVLKIANIPYDLTKSLVMTFLGPHAKTISPSFGPAVHIIMDRNSGKTMDCYVEFLSIPDARNCCNSINLRARSLNRISERLVDVTMSSQDELLSMLFPKAKSVKWENANPVIMEAQETWSSGFKNFVSAEELGLLVKHAEQPHRSNFTARSPQRPYEAMISLLAKFPWSSVGNYTLAHRTQIFHAVREMMSILSSKIRKGYMHQSRADTVTDLYGSPVMFRHGANRGSIGSDDEAPILNQQLIQDLLSAGLNAAGFSEKQRWELYEMCDYARHHFNVSPYLQYWPFEALGRKPRIEEDVIELYSLWLANNEEVIRTGKPFGSVTDLTRNIDMENNTMANIGILEWKMLDALLMGGLDNAVKEYVAQQQLPASSWM